MRNLSYAKSTVSFRPEYERRVREQAAQFRNA
jgi:hypothetical protein